MDITLKNLVEGVTAKAALIRAALEPAIPEVTTANLVAIGHAINTTGKYKHKLVFNTTTNVVLRSSGATAASHWFTLAGVDTHTPA